MKSLFRTSLSLAALCGTLLGMPGASNALYLDSAIIAYRIPEGKTINLDGKPDSLWKAIAGLNQGFSTISLNDYRRIVLLESDAIRNDDPRKYFQAPGQGSVSLLAAYDSKALYFFFLVRENTAFDADSRCANGDLWRANAPEVYLDPSPWNDSLYQAYFSADAGALTFGTSAKTIQLAKPASLADPSRFYFRDRTQGDRFALRTAPTGVKALTAKRTPSDALTSGVEMAIPFWGGNNQAFGQGSSLFISWGYNHYRDTTGTGCQDNPVAYRWAKHYKTYQAGDPKPPGWIQGDSTHYDPPRSWDGWGRLILSPSQPNVGNCRTMDESLWDVKYWQERCGNAVVGFDPVKSPADFRSGRMGLPDPDAPVSGRDSRGRLSRGGWGIYYLK